jgi:2-polyprenyl-6-methoxyphenol hydroxylase-like FAD-dependent oxidoreductase
LRGFEQLEDYVSVQIVRHLHGKETVKKTRVPWLIGTDGGHSFVRKILSLPFLGETREADEMIVGDIKVEAGLDEGVCDNCYLNHFTD